MPIRSPLIDLFGEFARSSEPVTYGVRYKHPLKNKAYLIFRSPRLHEAGNHTCRSLRAIVEARSTILPVGGDGLSQNSDVAKQSHESEVHMSLIVAVEKSGAWIIGREICLQRTVTRHDYDVFMQP